MMPAELIDQTITADNRLTEYATGRLTPAQHMLVSCQAEICDTIAERIAFQESVAASFVEQSESGEGLSAGFLARVMSTLPDVSRDDDADAESGNADRIAPTTLRNALGHGLRDLKWKASVPGVYIHDIIGNSRQKSGERVFLLRVKGGMSLPQHSHTGEEWTLLLTGSYTADGQRYSRGDLHIEDESHIHAPHVEEGEDCICLVRTEGPLVMQSFVTKMAQKFIGI